MASSEEAKAILKPIYDEYNRILDNGECDKAMKYYDPDCVLILTGRRCIHGREAIKEELLVLHKIMGKTMTTISNENYQMSNDYIILRAEYETSAKKFGIFKGKFTQIWRKSNDGYSIIYDLFDHL